MLGAIIEDRDILIGKRIFTTNIKYKGFLKPCEKQFGIKPIGLWYAIGSSWIDWCSENDFEGIGKYIYEIELHPTSNILFLSTSDDVLSFSKKYKKENIFSRQLDKPLKDFSSIFIDWEKVMEDYDGIEINPYFYQLGYTHNLIWYYGWDIPSGCIWTSKAKKKVNLLAKFNKEKEGFKCV